MALTINAARVWVICAPGAAACLRSRVGALFARIDFFSLRYLKQGPSIKDFQLILVLKNSLRLSVHSNSSFWISSGSTSFHINPF